MTSPYIPNTEQDRQAMLAAIGISSIQELFDEIPLDHRHPTLDLPTPLSELELTKELASLGRQNINAETYACFRGGGAYRHFIPSIVPHILSRGEFATSYTPYQPEASQGTLQTIYEFQSFVCELTGMEVTNAGMYDGATALAEAALMACRVTGRREVVILDTLNPTYEQVVRTYLAPQEIRLEKGSLRDCALSQDTACLIVQQPNFLGYLEELASAAERAHAVGGLLVVSVDPISLGMFEAPGQLGADIVTGEGQGLGVPLSFGGPYLGLFATRMDHLRQMPGRLVGRTVDARGQEGFVLTLQTREQHIRRERATSNICTTESLVALAATVYLAALGSQGLRQVAELCYHKAHYAAQRVAELKGFQVPFLERPFFKEFLVECPLPPSQINRSLLRRGILGGLDASNIWPNGWLLCVTELNTREEIDNLVETLHDFERG